jgi:hypothetical protein
MAHLVSLETLLIKPEDEDSWEDLDDNDNDNLLFVLSSDILIPTHYFHICQTFLLILHKVYSCIKYLFSIVL